MLTELQFSTAASMVSPRYGGYRTASLAQLAARNIYMRYFPPKNIGTDTTTRLVATVGSKSAARRVSKKDIQGVDVRRACEKILEPGAPIALRLQGNLLYGVSKVYEKQCTYMLSDVQKTQGHMAAFIRYLASNQLDPEAARSR